MTSAAPRVLGVWLPLLGGLVALSASMPFGDHGTTTLLEKPVLAAPAGAHQPTQPIESCPDEPPADHRPAFVASLDTPESPDKHTHDQTPMDVCPGRPLQTEADCPDPLAYSIIIRTGLWGDRWSKLMPPWRA